MNIELLEDIPLELDTEKLVRKLHVRELNGQRDRFVELLDQAREIARPKAVCRPAYIEKKTDNEVVVDGVELSSHILRVNLENVHRVFVYLATCGQEMEAWAGQFDDMVEKFWVGEIMEAAVHYARQMVLKHIDNNYQPGKMSSMNPGSLEDWPINEQQQLFELLGEGPDKLGVRLTDSFLMVPLKSVSGLRFPTEVNFENCMLCPRGQCPGRRAAYDPHLYANKYAASKDE
jgi:hypothetical protein